MRAAAKPIPTFTLISEERRSLDEIVDEIAALVTERARAGKNYGTLLIPEGLFEFIPHIPEEQLKGLTLSRDPHGNLEVSKIEMEKLLIALVKQKLDPAVPFAPVPFFLATKSSLSFHPL